MVEVKKSDVEFLKDEYREAQREIVKADFHRDLDNYRFYRGIKRGLETALVRMGVTNDELDQICSEQIERFAREIGLTEEEVSE